MNIVSINIALGRAVAEDGQVLAIVQMFDAWGDEVLFDWELPVTFIAGPTRSGHYLVDQVGSFEQQTDG